MIRIISALLFAATATLCAAQGKSPEQTGKSIELAKAAPQRYVVVKGDTLWDISAGDANKHSHYKTSCKP